MAMSKVHARPCIALLATLVLGACAGAELRKYPTPWVAPSRQVTPYFRPGSDPGLGRMEWRDTVRRREYNPYRLAGDIEQFMQRRGMFTGQPFTGLVDASERAPIREVVLPYRFTLVSIDPMVVLATPWAFGAGTREMEMPGYFSRHFPGIRRMANFIELGTTAPFAEGMQFFMPEQDAGPSPVAWNGEEAAIPLGGGERLVLARRDSVVETRRVAE